MIIENMSNKPENTLQTNFAKAEKKINKDMEKTLATFEG